MSAISTHACFALCMPLCHWNGCVNDACCAKCVAGAVAVYCADMISSVIIGTQKRQLSSNKSIKQKYLLVFRSKTELPSDVSVILVNINE